MGDSNVWPENLAKCFDLKSLRNLGGFEEEEAYEFFQELTEAYLYDASARIQNIHEALLSLNFEKIADEGHSLKGASRNIYARDLGDACEALEVSAKENNFQKATTVEVAPNDPGTDSGPGSGTASRSAR